MTDQRGPLKTGWRVVFLIIITILTPLVLWALTGGFFLNWMLAGGLPYWLYRVLGFGGGQLIYILLINLLWSGFNFFNLGPNYKESTTGKKEGPGCLIFLICVTLLIFLILAAIRVPSLADRLFPPRLSLGSDIMDAASQACNGLPVPNAAEYPGNTGLHPLVLTTPSGGWHSSTNTLPQAWKPGSVHDLQLVACATETRKIEIQSCTYSSNGEFKRYQEMMYIKIVAAKTGKLVKELDVEGDDPSECPERISSSGDHSSVGYVNVTRAMSPYVTP
jgi:hypothetical protein